MDEKTIEKIEQALEHGDKVELQPTKDGVIINRIRREHIAFRKKKKDPA